MSDIYISISIGRIYRATYVSVPMDTYVDINVYIHLSIPIHISMMHTYIIDICLERSS